MLRSEWVVCARGVVEARSDDTINPKMKTGEIEVNVHEVRLLNSAAPPPFAIDGCGVPTFYVPLRAFARALARFASGVGQMTSLSTPTPTQVSVPGERSNYKRSFRFASQAT